MQDSPPRKGSFWNKAALKTYFKKRTLTRLMIWAVLGFTGAFGFSVSYVLLHFGVGEMGIRYPLAVLGGYGVFLGLIRIWVEWERERYQSEGGAVVSPVFVGRNKTQPLGSREGWLGWLDFFDIPGELFAEPEGCLGGLGFLAVCGAAVVLVMALFNAEALIAEGFIDTFLVVGLYRRMRIAAREHWLGGMVRKTWQTAVIIAALLGIFGYMLQREAPEVKSIGPALYQLFHPDFEP